MAMTTDTRDGVTLSCAPGKEGETVVFDYTVSNGSSRDVFVSDAAARVEGRAAIADPNGVSVWRDKDRYAVVLKGVDPMPEDRDLLGRVMPLMRRLAPGEKLEQRLVLELPLAEHSAYFPIGLVRDYRLSEIEGVRLAIDVLPSPGASIPVPNGVPMPFAPRPVPYAEGYVDVGVRGTLPLMRRLVCGFRAHGLHLMMRGDAYPRPD